jgi:CheY-like chemotaxis protein
MAIIEKIVSGGQTGADRAALDFAIECGVPHGGWCPKGRLAEDGPIDPRYKLQETLTWSYAQRTEWNVRDSDGTVIFTIADCLNGGSRKTAQFTRKLGKPCLHLSAKRPGFDHAAALRCFIKQHRLKVLNVAGPRASDEPMIGKFVTKTLRTALTRRMMAKRTPNALLVDDDEFIRSLYRELLPGFRVLEAATSEQALGIAKRHRFNLVITDFAHPGKLNGLGFMVAFKKAHPTARVIMSTGYRKRGLRSQALRLGADAFLAKPFPPATFLAAVDAGMSCPARKRTQGGQSRFIGRMIPVSSSSTL